MRNLDFLVDQGRLKASKAPRNVIYTINCHTHYILNSQITCSVLLMILQDGPDVFYKKEVLKGKRLHELDQDIVHAIAGWYLSFIYLFY